MNQLALPGPEGSPSSSPSPAADEGERPKTGPWVLLGFGMLIAFVGGFGGWAATAPLQSAAVASGVVRSESNRKTVQHLEGGIIKEIKVSNGDEVEAGDLLIRLDDAQPRTTAAVLHSRWLSLTMQEQRLIAERDRRPEFTFPSAMKKYVQDPEARELYEAQLSIFNARAQALDSQIDILTQRKKQLRSQIESLDAQVKAAKRQLGLVSEEMKGVATLVQKGLEKRPRLLNIERQAAEIQGRLGEFKGQIARAEQTIGETDLQIINMQDNLLSEISDLINETRVELADVHERRLAAEDVLKRIEIRAVTPGTIVNMQFFTPGGVIGGGTPILDIVPKDDALVVEAKVQPSDIDIVRPGLEVEVRLTAYSQRNTPPLRGRVRTVSADSLQDETSGTTYYEARVVIPEEEFERVPDVELTPGMQADVVIVTGEKTVLSYLTDPLRTSLRHAFREN